MFGIEINTEEEIIEYAGKLRQMGARNVLVSRAGDGAVLSAENGEVIKMGVPSGKVLTQWAPEILWWQDLFLDTCRAEITEMR